MVSPFHSSNLQAQGDLCWQGGLGGQGGFGGLGGLQLGQ